MRDLQLFDMATVQLYEMAPAMLYYLDVLQMFEMGSCSVVVLLKKVVFLLYDMVTV